MGQTINLNNITVENRGTLAFGALRFGAYMSPNSIISTGDQLLNTGELALVRPVHVRTFNWSVTAPFVTDCGTHDSSAASSTTSTTTTERFEGNNAVAFVNGLANAQPFSILLERDSPGAERQLRRAEDQ